MESDKTVLPFYSQVQPERVKTGSFVVGRNERVLWNDIAQQAAIILKSFSGKFTASYQIQPQSFDFENWHGRSDVTKMVLYLHVLETWEDDRLKNSNGIPAPSTQMRNTGFAVYLVKNGEYHFLQWQGHPLLGLNYHANSGVVEFEDVKKMSSQIWSVIPPV